MTPPAMLAPTLLAALVLAADGSGGGGGNRPGGTPGQAPPSGAVDLEFARAAVAPPAGEHLYVLLGSGGIEGHHEPCGCVHAHSGGIARRAGLDELVAAASPGLPRAWVDAGSFAAPEKDEAGRERTRAVIAGLGRVGPVAVNVTDVEARAGLDFVAQEAEAVGLPLTSSSLVFDDGSLAFPALRVVELGGLEVFRFKLGGRRVAFVGLTRHVPDMSARLAGRAVATRPPSAALAAGLAAARREDVDHVVVLAALAPEELRPLLQEHPGVDVVLATSGTTQLAENWGDVRVAYSGLRGQVVAEMRVAEKEGRVVVTDRYHVLDPRWPADPELLEREREANRRINRLRREEAVEALRRPEPPDRPEPSHVGVAGCRACHVAEHLAWERGRHARALETLAASDRDFDVECVFCHVTGLGRGGFKSAVETPELAGVQCEACHGPGREHVASLGKTPTTGDSAACTSCHDAANDPDFDAVAAWRRLAHGGRAGALPLPAHGSAMLTGDRRKN